MGLGCNSVGVTGCRIIDSERERLIAILTNSFMPCNGRFPTLIALISIFFIGSASAVGSLLSALILTAFVVTSVIVTLVVSKLLSYTILNGKPSSFVLELPPYRTPQIGKVIVRSLLDRTVYVLGRAVMVAAPAGLLLWILGNVYVGDATLLNFIAGYLEPAGNIMGMDGVMLLAFILALPANETVIPVALMCYLKSGNLVEYESLSALKDIFVSNGWTLKNAICVCTFMLIHWPCSTTLLTVKKETGKWRWAALAFILPTAVGIIFCVLLNLIMTAMGF